MAMSEVFNAYTHGKGDMDSRTLLKLCTDTKLLDKKFTKTECDLVFTKVKTRGKQRLSFDEFERALEFIAVGKKCSVAEVKEKIAKKGGEGPQYAGTEMEKVRFYDDKTTYTGVHAHGGPTVLGSGSYNAYTPSGTVSAITLDKMCDRSTPNIRGVNYDFMSKSLDHVLNNSQDTGGTCKNLNITLDKMCDRSTPNIRGVNKSFK